jgi:hypothetical protein
MNKIDYIINEIKSLPSVLLEEVADYIGYIKQKYMINKNGMVVNEITLVSEKSLAKDWLKPEEDEAWQNL